MPLPTVEEIGRRVLWVKQNVARNPYIPHDPTPRQTAFLSLDCEEAGYGGAAGSGKSDCLLMDSLMYVDRPEYAGLLIRKTFAELALPGALMDRSFSWLLGKGCRWNGETHTWHFPSKATLTFGHMENTQARERYQSAEFSYIGVDEAVQLAERDYLFLASRIRRRSGSTVPGRLRSATNPPTRETRGSDWYKIRFSPDQPRAERPFVRATLWDNPHLDIEPYLRMLDKLDPVTRKRLRDGDWNVIAQGDYFRRHWFPVVEFLPRIGYRRQIRWWDTAATEEPGDAHAIVTGKKAKDPDYTVGLLLAQDHRGHCFIIDVVRGRWGPGKVEDVILNTAILDGHEVSVRWGEEPASAGKHYSATLRSKLRGWDRKGIHESGDKEVRARPVSSAAEHGEISVVRAPWYEATMQELECFPGGDHDDIVDALSGAFNQMSRRGDVADLAEINRQLSGPTGLTARRPV